MSIVKCAIEELNQQSSTALTTSQHDCVFIYINDTLNILTHSAINTFLYLSIMRCDVDCSAILLEYVILFVTWKEKIGAVCRDSINRLQSRTFSWRNEPVFPVREYCAKHRYYCGYHDFSFLNPANKKKENFK